MADLLHTARLMQGVEAEGRKPFCETLIAQAHAADKYVRRLGKLHPVWGDGSLRSAAVAQGSHRVRQVKHAEFLICLSMVLEALRMDKSARSQEYHSPRVCSARNRD